MPSEPWIVAATVHFCPRYPLTYNENQNNKNKTRISKQYYIDTIGIFAGDTGEEQWKFINKVYDAVMQDVGSVSGDDLLKAFLRILPRAARRESVKYEKHWLLSMPNSALAIRADEALTKALDQYCETNPPPLAEPSWAAVEEIPVPKEVCPKLWAMLARLMIWVADDIHGLPLEISQYLWNGIVAVITDIRRVVVSRRKKKLEKDSLGLEKLSMTRGSIDMEFIIRLTSDESEVRKLREISSTLTYSQFRAKVQDRISDTEPDATLRIIVLTPTTKKDKTAGRLGRVCWLAGHRILSKHTLECDDDWRDFIEGLQERGNVKGGYKLLLIIDDEEEDA